MKMMMKTAVMIGVLATGKSVFCVARLEWLHPNPAFCLRAQAFPGPPVPDIY